MSGKNRLFKSGKTIRIRWDFCRSQICKKCRIPTGAEIWYSPIQNHHGYWLTACLAIRLLRPLNTTGSQWFSCHAERHSVICQRRPCADNMF